MRSPPSSRTVDPRLAAAGGVMRDTLGAIHNLQHLLGSVRVGPKALVRVIPDVQASSGPMIVAAQDLVAGVRGGPLSVPSLDDLKEILTTRMRELERALGHARRSSIRASERLALEVAVGVVARELDGAVALVDLLVEASARGSVPVDIGDVIREGAMRKDAGVGKARRARVTFAAKGGAAQVQVNPRLSLKLFLFAVALSTDREGNVHAEATEEGTRCVLRLTSGTSANGDPLTVVVPQLIGLSTRSVGELAQATGASLVATADPKGAWLSFPLVTTE